MAVSDWPKELHRRVWAPSDTRCEVCRGKNVSWWVENAIWNQVMEFKSGVLCPTCFLRRADEKGIGRTGTWQLYPPSSLS